MASYYSNKMKGVFQMAVFDISMHSSALGHITHMTAIVPTEVRSFPGMPAPEPKKDLRVLILLHGYSGIDTDWIRGSSIAELAMMHNLAVFMPDGGNSFYLNDEIRGELYEDLVCKEILTFVRNTFPVSKRREDTFIGGFSMGGYGALHSALKHPDVFAGCIALSSALIVDTLDKMTPEMKNPIARYSYYTHIFGDLSKVKGSDMDPKALAKAAVELGDNKPALFLACGTEDFGIAGNRDYSAYLDSIGYDHLFYQSTGVHNWLFWDEYIKKAVDWLDTLKA